MSGRYDFNVATQIARSGPPFDALIMAAAIGADRANLLALTRAFPDLIEEVRARHDAPGGRLESDGAGS